MKIKMQTGQIIIGDALETLRGMADGSVHCVVTSPPYWGLRDYGIDGQLGLEPTPEAFVAKMVEVFSEVRRVLRDDGTLWLNLGDSYNANQGAGFNAHENTRSHLSGEGVGQKRIDENNRNTVQKSPYGLKPKNLLGIPWRVALALQADGWYLRSDIIWHKPNPMPESVTDRPTKAHEYLFLLSKSARYYYDAEAIREDGNSEGSHSRGANASIIKERNDNGRELLSTPTSGRNRRTVWTIPTHSFSGAHFATFPPKLIEPCILAGVPARCCSECGAPWIRENEHTAEPDESAKGSRFDQGKTGARDGGDRTQPGERFKTVTGEPRPTCKCNAATTAGTVLDPFFGAGTTGLVACELARRWIGIELSPEYAEMARARIQPTDEQGDMLRLIP